MERLSIFISQAGAKQIGNLINYVLFCTLYCESVIFKVTLACNFVHYPKQSLKHWFQGTMLQMLSEVRCCKLG